MTIRVYPSRLEGEPLETHKITQRQSIEQWLIEATNGAYSADATDSHPTIVLNDQKVEQSEWALTFICATDELDIYIEPRASAVIAVISVVIALVVTVMTMRSMKAGTPATQTRGKTLDDPAALANQVKWSDPIPEIAGSPITYPDYITPPRRYYVNRTQQWVDSLVCIGVGEYQTDKSQMWIGDTSLPTYGNDAQVTVFQPNEEIPADLAAWWHTPEEVGFTTFGGAGMTLGPAVNVARVWPSQSFTFTGQNITGTVPPPWEAGTLLRAEAEHLIEFSGNTLRSAVLDTLDISTGDEIELTGEREGDYIVTGITGGTGASVGSAALATGGSAPSRYDFDVTPATLNITLNSITYTVVLSTAVVSIDGIISAINAQLNGSPVRARNSSGRIELYQLEPFTGGVFSLTGDVATLLGSVTYTAGVATAAAKGATYTVAGENFGSGSEIAAAGRAGMLYAIIEVTGNAVKVSPPDVEFWSGFPSGVLSSSSVELDSGSIQGGWIGPFAAAPSSEKSDCFEVGIFYPQGLISYSKKGKIRSRSAGGVIQWREIGDTTWQSRSFSNRQSTADQIGFTYRIEHGASRVEVRVRAHRAASTSARSSDQQQWTGLRSRIIGAPTRYPNLTLAHVRLRSGDKVSGGVDNKFSVRARRILPTIEDPATKEPTRDIAPFFVHMMNSVGYGRDLIDMPTITALHKIWQERRDTFDLAVSASSTLKAVANSCLGAGFAELTLRNGKISAARDAYRLGTPSRIYSPQELRAGGEIVESTQTVMPDDIDGVDIEYIDYATGRTLTEPYRLIGDEGRRVEVIKAAGVTDRTRAWRIAARRRRIAAYRRTAYKGGTEMAAMNSYYMDYIGLQDGIPEYGQSAFVLAVDGLTLTLSEPIQVPTGGAIAMIRRQDGTATAPIAIASISGHDVTLVAIPADAQVTPDPNRATVVYIGSRTQIVHEALITEVRPAGDGRVEFQAVNMDNRVYLEDDLGPDQVILTSRPYAIERYDLAAGYYDVGVEIKEIPEAKGISSAGLSGITLAARLINTVEYGEYSQPLSEAAGLTGITLAAKLQTVVEYGEHRQPTSETAGLTGITLAAKLSRAVIDTNVNPESAAGHYDVGATIESI